MHNGRLTMKKIVLTILTVCFVLAVGAGVFYEIIYPNHVARQYQTDLRASAQDLRIVFEKLEASTDTPLLYEPNTTTSNRETSNKKLRQAIADSRQAVDQFQSISAALPSVASVGLASTYAQASTLQNHAYDITAQATDVLDRFETTITFLFAYSNAHDKAMRPIDQFNQIVNLDTLAGQSAAMTQTAAQINATADALQDTPVTSELVDTRTAAVQALRQAAEGFADMAGALNPPNDTRITTAATTIETAGKQLEKLHQVTYADTILRLRAIQNVHDLNEKLDLVLF